MIWIHSISGVPWTTKKLRQAVAELRPGASVGFLFGADALR